MHTYIHTDTWLSNDSHGGDDSSDDDYEWRQVNYI